MFFLGHPVHTFLDKQGEWYLFWSDIYLMALISHASGLTEAAEIWPIEFQNKQALGFWPVDGRPHPVSVSMDPTSHLLLPLVWLIGTSKSRESV